ncbi:cell division protein FtsQ [Naumannella cuiyingiana]|uniref:Cell division protein FtsQ n=1 Tax=Naumannella cuiyingiana TaxID=1347891 RepID=A0A7Z0DAT0_9ACTN|nr:cell division protein FtsQ [Naumannella cuiyingiana]
MSTATRFDSYRDERRRRRARGRARRVVIIAAVLLVVGVLGYVVGFSPALVVRQVTVEGTSVLTPAQVGEAAAIPQGTPLVRVSESVIGERVAALPAVRRATVSRELPGTVRIVVTERTPVLVTATEEGPRLVDADGAAFPPGDKVPDDLPVAAVQGGDPRLLASVARVAGALTPELRDRGRELRASSRDDITLVVDGRPDVFFGSSDDAELKAQVATALLSQKGRTIDVSAPGNPVVR